MRVVLAVQNMGNATPPTLSRDFCLKSLKDSGISFFNLLVSNSYDRHSFESHLRALCKHDPYSALTQAGSYRQSWFKSYDEIIEEKSKPEINQIVQNFDIEGGIYGLDYKQGTVREWNDEYQQCKELPKDTQMQRI